MVSHHVVGYPPMACGPSHDDRAEGKKTWRVGGSPPWVSLWGAYGSPYQSRTSVTLLLSLLVLDWWVTHSSPKILGWWDPRIRDFRPHQPLEFLRELCSSYLFF